MQYQAIYNSVGYLSEQDEIPLFDTAAEAWGYLAQERRDHEDGEEVDSGHSIIVQELERRAAISDSPLGVVLGDTPGYTGAHDIPIVYEVRIAE